MSTISEKIKLLELQIWSGAQTGVDQGALEAAVELGVPTMGYIPRGARTETGPLPNAKIIQYNLTEVSSPKWAYRTQLNVDMTDGTLLIGDRTSPGSKMTAAEAERMFKPLFWVPLRYMSVDQQEMQKEIKHIVFWMINNNISTLNVAGNRESKAPGIQAFTKQLVTDIILARLEKEPFHA